MKEKIVSQEITQELRQAYLDYAMSVIVSRALPDARDGLKPVQRRILYTMKELGLWAREKFVKCANIVGNVLARYHPHGDQAVYDALVRMAQDFSLRYPLVWGQGNFGCFTKDTKVKLTDGRSISFEELIKEQKQGKRHWTFTFNHQTKKIEIAEIKNPRLTRRNEKIMEVILDNGEKIRCTLDHLFMLRDGTYKQAKDLKPGDSLMPLYIKAYDGKEDRNLKGYEMVYQPVENKWELIHRLADEWNLKNGVYKKSAGKIRHHLDFNKLNNNPDNILRIKWEDHWKYHKEIASERHRSDPEYVKKIAEGRRKFWAKKENKIFRAKLQSERNKRMWRNPLYRTRWIEARKKIWQDLEYKEFMRKVSSKNLKRLWNRKDFRELLSKLKSQELKMRWKDENYRRYWEEKMREISLKIWSNPKHRDYISHLMKEKFKDPEQREKQSKIAKALWQNPEYRAKFSPDHFSKIAKKLWENPKIREFHREKAREQWQDQKFRKKFISGVIAANRRRLEENPNFMKELTQKAKISLHKNWQDPSYKEKVIRSKILGYVYSLLKKYKKVTPEVYEKERTNNGVPKIANALNYFNDFSEILTEAKKYNHKVIKTRILRKREDVYDLTVEPWHNFALAAGIFVHNSIDGDPPAQMRYSESKLTKIAEEMLVDIDKETVDFRPNYDNTREEPVVLPAKIPNLIVNGSLGIAVGMATSIPPHNLTEVMSAIKFLIKKPNAEIDEILQYIKGPDFPTGGTIYGGEKLKEIYAEGKGGITLAGDVLIEKTRKERLIITSIPWQVNKAELVKEIANLALERVLPDIKDVRDESSREGVRIVIETRPSSNLEKLKENLYRLTSLSKTFYFNLIALENGIQPKLFSLKEILLSWIEHRREIIKRRTKFDLEKNKERVHLLEGFDKALENLDKVINTIKKSKDRQDALKNLMEKFKLTQKQADAILEMPLRTLTQMERHKILEELKERRSIIKELEEILRSAKRIDEIILSEADEIIKNYPSERLTKIVSEGKVFETKEIVPEEKVWLMIDQKNLVSLTPIDKFNLDKVLKNQNLPKILKPVSTKDKLILVSKLGKVYNIPVANFYHSAKYLESQIILDKNDEILEIMVEEKAKYLFLIFDNGFGKKMKLEDCLTNRKAGVSTAKNEVISAFLINGGEIIGTLSESGNILLFKENLPVQGRSAKGVKVMKVKNEKIISAFLRGSNELLLIFDQGFYKKIDLQEIKVQNRGTKGVKLFESKYGKLLLAKTIKEEKEIVISDDTLKRVEIKKLPTLKRTQSAKKIDNLNLINSILLI